MTVHRLLERQIKKVLDTDPARWSDIAERLRALSAGVCVHDDEAGKVLSGLPLLLERVSESYTQQDRDLTLVRRSLELSSAELTEVNQRLREEGKATAQALTLLRDAFNLLLKGYNADDQQNTDGSLADISEKVLWLIRQREQIRQALSHSEERFNLAMQGANDGLWDWDLAADRFYYSPRWKSMIGYTEADISDATHEWSSRIHPDDLTWVKTATQHYFRNEIPHYDLVYRFRHKHGHYLWVRSKAIVVRDAQGVPTRVVGTHSDITEAKLAEDALRAAKDEAERASQAKSDFLSSMSHELRTPLNAILGFAQILEFDNDLNGEQQEGVNEILKAGRHLLSLINEVLDLAKVESGHIELSIEPIAISVLIDEAMALAAPLAEKRNIRLIAPPACNDDVRGDRVHGDRVHGDRIHGDHLRVKQTLLNLLSNAIKYNIEGGTVTLALDHTDTGFVRLSVTDTGLGIAPDKLQDLFQPFNRLGAETTDVEGTGIGLVITRRLIEAMGGRVGVESQVGTGSRFWITLPLITETSPPPTAPLAGIEQTRTVLYIEDNPVNLKLVTQLLSKLPQTRLLTAHSPEDGIAQAKSAQPDLILCDIHMPGMSGFDVLQVLKTLPLLQQVPVVALSANALPCDIEKAKAAGFVDYLTKPIDFALFRKVVENLLDHHH